MLCLLLYFHARSRHSPVRVPGRHWLVALAAVEVVVLLGTAFGAYATFAPIGIANAPLVVLGLTLCTWLYQRRGGPGGGLAMCIMLVFCAGALLRMAALSFVPHLAPDLDLYALTLPGMLVGLFAITSWSQQQARQRMEAQRVLAQWQDQEQQRLALEVSRKTHALNGALDQAERRAREQKELLAYISHDLRAPASTIIGNLRLMRGAQDDAHASPDPRLAAIERSATYQLELIDDLVSYAKQELTPLSLEAQPMRLRTLIDDVAQYADVLARRQDNAFALRIEGTLPQAVYLDGKRVQQVLLNLLSNAAKFTRDGRIGLRVWATEDDGGDVRRLHFEVEDSGTGIAADQLGRMRQALAENAPSLQGGLGLVIAQRIAQRMDGRLSIHSQAGAGGGTRVGFSITARLVQQPLPPQTAASPAAPAPAIARPRRARPRRRPARPLPAMAPLSAAQKEELEALARDGRWSDLHEWTNALAGQAHAQALVHAIRQALDRLDFEHIRLIARTAPERSS